MFNQQPAPQPPLLDVAALTTLYDGVRRHRTRRNAAAGTMLPGTRPQTQRGVGLELMDTRAYQYGDDLRHLDWKATARSGKPMTKVFRTERQRSTFLVVDRGATMAFGTFHDLKATVAARCAAILAFAATLDGETVGALILNNAITGFAPSRNRARAWAIATSAAAPLPHPQPAKPARLWDDPTLWSALATTPPATNVFLITDGQQLESAHFSRLRHLARHRRVVTLRIWDPGESRLPRARHLALQATDTHPQLHVRTRNPAIQDDFAAQVQSRYAAIHHALADSHVRTLALNAQSDLFAQCQEWL